MTLADEKPTCPENIQCEQTGFTSESEVTVLVLKRPLDIYFV